MNQNNHKSKLILFFLLLPILAFTQAKQTPQGLDLYLVIGQSNMAGRAEIRDQEQAPLTNVYLFTGEATNPWTEATNPLNRYSTIRKEISMQRLSPAYTFAKNMVASRKKAMGLVMNARGGTQIVQWLPGTHYYAEAVKQTKAALKYGTLKGIIWHQGEGDADSIRTNLYLGRLEILINAFREEFGNPELPFVAGQLSEDRERRIPLNKALKGLPDFIPHTGIATADGTTTMEGTHFDSDSQNLLGERYAAEMLRLLTAIEKVDKDFNYLFEKGMSGYQCFRIPAIIQSKQGTLLAFAEARKGSCSDTGDIDLVMRRSTDNGKTWSALSVIWDDGENVCGNPVPVVEQESGRICLLLTWNLGSDHERDIIAQTSKDTRRVYVTQSEDDGLNWATPKEITASTKKDNWTWYATGPGHGIQLSKKSKHKGRLIIPCDHIEANTKHYYSHSIYSDDKGQTWQLGGSTPQHQVNECTAVELSNGDLMLNMRNYDRNHKNRKVSISKDGGLTWSSLENDDTLIEPICQASMLSNHKKGKQHALFFSNPASQEGRVNMTLRQSKDNGKTWPKAIVIHAGPSAYSDLVMLNDHQIGILYEGGVDSPYEGIAFEVVRVEVFEK
ncbi:MAG: sialate O-acetylesterase [Saprospiraceae bacterium]